MKITFNKWGGSAPRLDPKRTPDGFAVIAKNTRPDPYSLKAWNQPASVGVTVRPSTKTIHRYTKDHWFQFDYDASVVPAPIVNDPNHEVIFTTPTEVRYTRNSLATSSAPYPGTSYKLGIPRPAQPTLSGGLPASNTESGPDIEDVAYTVTFVDAFGREGAASPASRIIRVKQDAGNRTAVTIDRPAIPSGSYNFGDGAKWRIYRTNTTSSGSGVFQYVTECPIATTVFSDYVLTDSLLEALSTADWYPPPDNDTALWPSGPMKGLVSVANSYLAGFTGRTLCFSIPNIPHAWPPSFQIVLEYDIVGLAAVGSDVAVLTTGHPYIVSGASPGNLTAIKLPDPQACVSAKSIVALEDSVIFASPDGLCAVKGYRAQLISAQIFDERSWAAIKPWSMRAANYEGAYIATTDTVTFMFIPDLDEAQYRTIDFRPSVMFTDLSTDTLYYHEGDGVLKAFNKGTGLYNYEWLSGKVDTLRSTNFGWARVYASEYPVEFKIVATHDGRATADRSYTATSPKPFRLAGGYLATEFSVSISGTKTVHDISLANSLHELEAV